MYWLQTDVNTEGTDPLGLANIKGSMDFIPAMYDAIRKSLDPTITEKFFLKLEQDAKNANATISGQITQNVKVVEKLLYDVFEQNVKLGFQYQDAADFLKQMAGDLGKSIPLSKENTESAIILSKAMGVSATEVGKLYSSFMKMGYSQEATTEKLEKTFKTAREYGIDANKLTATVAANVFKAQAYGFKDGIDGLTKMAAQAQKVGVSMELAQKAADKAFDPEGAIEMASAMQMLGGNVGALADPFQLMYMAQSDVGGLQEQIGKASASMVDFNKKTGEFSISPEMRRNLKEQANAMNMSYDELADAAIKFRKEQELSSRVDMAGFSEEERNLITSFAEIGKGGEVKVKIPGTDQLIDVESLRKNGDIMEKLKDAQADASKDSKEVALDQLSVLKQINNSLTDVSLQGIRGGFANKDRIIDANKVRADEKEFGYDKLKEELGHAITTEMEAYITTIENVNQTLVLALTSSELSKGIELMSETAQLVFKTMETAATVLADILQGDGSQALADIKTALDDLKTKSETIITNSGIDTEEIKKKVEEKIEELKNVPIFKGLLSENAIIPTTPEIIPDVPKLNDQLEQIAIINKEVKSEQKTLMVGGEAKIILEVTSNDQTLSAKIDEKDLNDKIKNKVTEMFSKDYSQTLINALPVGG